MNNRELLSLLNRLDAIIIIKANGNCIKCWGSKQLRIENFFFTLFLSCQQCSISYYVHYFILIISQLHQIADITKKNMFFLRTVCIKQRIFRLLYKLPTYL